jgi:tetratricopeptide (TPR) repeat protein
MKDEERFFTSLERYLRKMVARSALPRYWVWVASGGVIVVIEASVVAKNGIVGARNIDEAVRIAARAGDYGMARGLIEQKNKNIEYRVLGANTELEDLVYPERKVERRVAELKDMLAKYPENKDIYTNLASLYFETGNNELAESYAEKARVLDPNGK